MSRAPVVLALVLVAGCSKSGRNISSRKKVQAWTSATCSLAIAEGSLTDESLPAFERYEDRYVCAGSEVSRFAKTTIVTRGQNGERRDDPDVCALSIGPFAMTARQDWSYLSDAFTDAALAERIRARLVTESRDATGFDLVFVQDGVKVVAQQYGLSGVAQGLLRIDACHYHAGSSSYFQEIPYITKYLAP